jgi:exonuclease III
MNSGFKNCMLWVALIFSLSLWSQEKKEYKIVSIAFYNLENLYDIYDDPNIFDDDRTPTGKDKWTEKIYQKKLQNMAFAISQIGLRETGAAPTMIGVCEIENRQVLEDLIKEPALTPYNYGIIHYDSPDHRGIDVAFLYQKEIFTPTNSASHELMLYDPKDFQKRAFTRDQLVVTGSIDSEEMHFIVNHWPSRSGGEKISSYKRENAARLNLKILDSLQRKDPYAKVIIMGDFNDDPHNRSIKKILAAKEERSQVQMRELYNPMASLQKMGLGSLAYRDGWNLFDQILLSHAYLRKDTSSFSFFKAGIFNEQFLITPTGQYKGYPFRSFGNGAFTGGYSDHFPVYVLLVKAN